jgi:uncharacterized protein (TIGR01777 family)
MMIPFKLGLGGRLGSGKQYWSWISLTDFLRAALFCLTNKSLRGPVNFTAPNPVTNAEFTKALAKALHRPALLPTPPFVLIMMLGQEMADLTLHSSERVIPAKLLNSGFEFQYPTIEEAMKEAVRRKH